MEEIENLKEILLHYLIDCSKNDIFFKKRKKILEIEMSKESKRNMD